MKDKILKNEFWSLSLKGSLQRASIYSKDEEQISYSEEFRHTFRTGLREFIETMIVNDYEIGVTEEKHLSNIMALKEHAEFIGQGIIHNNTFNYGVAQKLLNLYLRYLWLGDFIKEPVHFPVTNQIQECLMMGKESISWTKMTKVEEYMRVINKAKTILADEDRKWNLYDIKSIAELDLSFMDVEVCY